jgi:hypothetical protein
MKKFSNLAVVFFLMVLTFASGTGLYTQLPAGEGASPAESQGEPVHI